MLVVKRGPNAGSRFRLDQPVTSAGRHPESDIFLDDVSISRRHAEFRRENGEYLIADTGSLNGTYVNRKPVESVALANGDEIQMGKFRLVFLTRPRRTDTHPPRTNRPKTVMGATPDIVGGRHRHVGHHSARQMTVITGQTRYCWPRPDQVDQQRVVEPPVLRLTAANRRRDPTLTAGYTVHHPVPGMECWTIGRTSLRRPLS